MDHSSHVEEEFQRRQKTWFQRPLTLDKGTDRLTLNDLFEISGGDDIEYDDGQIILLAQRERCHVHHAQAIADYFSESDLVYFDSIFIFLRIGSIDSIDTGSF